MDLAISAVCFGMVVASILALAAVGFTLQYGVTNIFNLAFPETMVASGFVAYLFNSRGWSIWLCLVVAAVFGGALSLALNVVLYRPFIRRGSSFLALFIASLATGMVIHYTIAAIAAEGSFRYDLAHERAFTIASANITWPQITIMVISAGAMVTVHLFLRRSRLGKAMRAPAVDADLARSCGVPTEHVVNVAWLVSGALCGLAGVTFFMTTRSFGATSGRAFLVLIIAAAILGGIGDAYGAMLGAVVIGVTTELGAVWLNPGYKTAVALLILLAVLLVRPQGIRAEFARVREMQA